MHRRGCTSKIVGDFWPLWTTCGWVCHKTTRRDVGLFSHSIISLVAGASILFKIEIHGIYFKVA